MTTWPVSVMSTRPVLVEYPVFALTLNVTVDPFTLAVSHIASEFRSARSVPRKFFTTTFAVPPLYETLTEVGLAVIYGVGVGVGPALWYTLMITRFPLPVSVISTLPLLDFVVVFFGTVIVTELPLTDAVNHMLSEFRSARSVPFLFEMTTFCDPPLLLKLSDVFDALSEAETGPFASARFGAYDATPTVIAMISAIAIRLLL